MAYEINIAGTIETSSPELFVIGNRVRARIFANRLHMTSGFEAGIEYVGTVTDVEVDDGYIDAVIKCDNGKQADVSFRMDGGSFDRIVQAA